MQLYRNINTVAVFNDLKSFYIYRNKSRLIGSAKNYNNCNGNKGKVEV